MASIAVLGAGSWGTALALQITKSGHSVNLWGRDSALIDRINETRRNDVYLPDIDLPAEIKMHSDLSAASAGNEFIILAVPVAAVRQLSAQLAEGVGSRLKGLAWACKGIELNSGTLIHEVVGQTLGDEIPVAAIGGPSFANEVVAEKPTAITIASPNPDTANGFADLLHGVRMRVYTTTDIIGVEIGGALKNVIAIAAGICDGLAFGENAKAALITRGLNEVLRLTVAAGGRRETIMGLSGLGDIVLSCSSSQSRNHQYGIFLGEGLSSERALEKTNGVVEGHSTTSIALQLAGQYGIEMPICEQVERVIKGEATPSSAVEELLRRPGKPEDLTG